MIRSKLFHLWWRLILHYGFQRPCFIYKHQSKIVNQQKFNISGFPIIVVPVSQTNPHITSKIDFLEYHLGYQNMYLVNKVNKGSYGRAYSVQLGPKAVEYQKKLFSTTFNFSSSTRFCLKVMRGENNLKDTCIEAGILNEVQPHPNIVTYLGAFHLFYGMDWNHMLHQDPNHELEYDHFLRYGYSGILEELCTMDLETYMNKKMRNGQTLTELEVVDIFRQLGSALAYIHQAPHFITHYDLKPANVGVCILPSGWLWSEPKITFKLIDFGWAVRHTAKQWMDANEHANSVKFELKPAEIEMGKVNEMLKKVSKGKQKFHFPNINQIILSVIGEDGSKINPFLWEYFNLISLIVSLIIPNYNHSDCKQEFGTLLTSNLHFHRLLCHSILNGPDSYMTVKRALEICDQLYPALGFKS